jgi:hypothetical protein
MSALFPGGKTRLGWLLRNHNVTSRGIFDKSSFGGFVLCSMSSYVFVWPEILVLLLVRLESVLLTAGRKVLRRPHEASPDHRGPSYDLLS